MLDLAELDAVIICSPHTLHFQQATYVLNKDLHV
jgi:predicted dehydrogenase